MPKSYSVGLVGESNYQDAIKGLREGERVFLVHEPDNPHDPRAVVCRDDNGAPVGYIPRDSWLTGALIDEGKGSRALVERIEGGDAARPSLGVVLAVELGEKGAPVAAGPATGKKAFTGFSDEDKARQNRQAMRGCLIVVVLLAVVAMCSRGSDDGSSPSSSSSVAAEDVVEMPSDEEMMAGAAASPGNGLTGAQANALRSAQDYIRMSGFSRKGLIDQLSSEYGSGYSVADATAAVDSLDVDWNEQAARSARDYVNMSGFSCAGLVKQLSSDYGSKYTRSEAEFGAREAGAC